MGKLSLESADARMIGPAWGERSEVVLDGLDEVVPQCYVIEEVVHDVGLRAKRNRFALLAGTTVIEICGS